MFSNPKVSVVIPTYKRPKLLRRAIRSVLEQSYENLEIIVIDDSPTNESEITIKEFLDENVRYLRRDRRKGVASAKNLGVRMSSGDFIAFLGDDDEWFSNKLEQQVNLFRKVEPETGVVHSNCFVDNGKETFLYHKAETGKQSLDELLEYDYIADSTGLIKKECFKKVGYFDESLIYAEDWDSYIRIAKQFKIKYISEPLAILHITSDGLGRDTRRAIRGHQMVLAKHWQEFKKHRKTLSRHLCQIGSTVNFIGEKKRGRKFLINAFKIFPFNPEPILLIALEIFRNFAPIQLRTRAHFWLSMTVLKHYYSFETLYNVPTHLTMAHARSLLER